MRRRDLLTYDLGDQHHPAATRVSRRMIILLAGVIVTAMLLVIWMVQSSSRTSSAANDEQVSDEQVSAVGAPASPTPSTQLSSTPVTAGSDDATTTTAPARSQQATINFVAAWLQTDPDRRKQALQETAAPGLAEQLTLTATENIPDAKPAGPPVLEHASAYSAQFVQKLTDGTAIRIYLAADPQADHGWVATSVEQA
jgi:hypothetical protein